MTETMYYSSTASLRELLDSPAIDDGSKANIRAEIAHRQAACIMLNPEALKGLRETLCLAQTAIAQRDPEPRIRGDLARLGALIQAIDQHRPLGADGKHGDLHTPTCGCDVTATIPRCESRPYDRPQLRCEGQAGHRGTHEADGWNWA